MCNSDKSACVDDAILAAATDETDETFGQRLIKDHPDIAAS